MLTWTENLGYQLTRASFEASLHTSSESSDTACCQAPQSLWQGRVTSYKHVTHGLKCSCWKVIKKKKVTAITHKYGKQRKIWNHIYLFHTYINVNRPWCTKTSLCPTHLAQSDVRQGTNTLIDKWKQNVNVLKRLACKLQELLFSHPAAESSQSYLNTPLSRMGQYKYYKLWLATKDLVWTQQKRRKTDLLSISSPLTFRKFA